MDTAGLTTQTWIADELVALLPATRKGQRPAALRFAQLLDRPFVGLSAESGLSRLLLLQAARRGRVPQNRVRVSSSDAMARIVEAGVGVVVVPLSAASRWRDLQGQVASLEGCLGEAAVAGLQYRVGRGAAGCTFLDQGLLLETAGPERQFSTSSGRGTARIGA